MSSLMEQAVVDADKLRAAAMRNAENSILERYSSDIKGALKTILEQAPPGMMDPMAMMEPAAPPAIEDEIPLAATGGEKLCPCPDDEVTVPITINLDDLIDIADMIKDEDAGVTPQMLEEPPMDPMMMGQPPMDPMLMESELVDISDILREDNHTVERADDTMILILIKSLSRLIQQITFSQAEELSSTLFTAVQKAEKAQMLGK